MNEDRMKQQLPKLVFDFEADIRGEYAAKLAGLGVPVPPESTSADLIVRFFSLPQRVIDRGARHVVWSAELRARKTNLPDGYQTALENIERTSVAGGDLNPYQSRDLAKKPWKTDPQLLEWGITHFHLGLGPAAKHPDTIAGTKDLLFLVVRRDALYFVEVMPHESFSDQRVFAAHTALSGNVLGLEYNANAEERSMLRKCGVNVLTQGGDGKVYGAVGGGVTTKGTSTLIVQTYLIPRSGPMSAWRRMCEQTPERILSMIPDSARTGLTKIQLRASEVDGEIEFTAENLVRGPLVLGRGYAPCLTPNPFSA